MSFPVKDGAGLGANIKSRLDGTDVVTAQDTIPFALADLIWVVDQPMNADTNYASVDCQRFGTVWLEFIMAATAEGVLFLEWSLDDTTFYPFAFDPAKFSVIDPASDLTVDEAAGSITVDPLPGEARFSLGVEKPPPFMRGRWDFTAGSVTGMDAKNFGRG